MSIERWDPFRDMISLRDAMNSLLAESFVRPGGPPATGGAATLAPGRRRDGGRVRDQGVAAGHQARGRAHHRPRRHAHDPRREQGRGGEEGHALAHARTSRQFVRALHQPGHPDPRRRGERPVRSRGLDADLAQDGGGQAEADQGGERPDTAPVERSSGSSSSGAEIVSGTGKNAPPLSRRSRAGSPSRPTTSPRSPRMLCTMSARRPRTQVAEPPASDKRGLRPSKGVIHWSRYDLADHLDPVPRRGLPHLGPQPELGLRPERGLGLVLIIVLILVLLAHLRGMRSAGPLRPT